MADLTLPLLQGYTGAPAPTAPAALTITYTAAAPSGAAAISGVAFEGGASPCIGVMGATQTPGPPNFVMSTAPASPCGVAGFATLGGVGVYGHGVPGAGVHGESESSVGVQGVSNGASDAVLGTGAHNGVHGQSSSVTDSGVWGENTHGGYGVSGSTNSAATAGVWGDNKGVGPGVSGTSALGPGVSGTSADESPGVSGTSALGDGVFGRSLDTSGALGPNVSGVHGQGMSAPVAGGIATTNGVWGENTGAGDGVVGTSISGNGVRGRTGDGNMSGVVGQNTNGGNGVYGNSVSGRGVAGTSQSGTGVYGEGKPAGYFEGDVVVTGDVTLTGADCAEQFDVSSSCLAEPGTVMVINGEGELEPSERPYDKRAAGVVSGAGDLRAALILDKQKSDRNRASVALVGKVYCKVDADHAPVEVGDLLTSSSTLGHAMKADDPSLAFGAVLGKALRSLKSGKGMIPILVALQ